MSGDKNYDHLTVGYKVALSQNDRNHVVITLGNDSLEDADAMFEKVSKMISQGHISVSIIGGVNMVEVPL